MRKVNLKKKNLIRNRSGLGMIEAMIALAVVVAAAVTLSQLMSNTARTMGTVRSNMGKTGASLYVAGFLSYLSGSGSIRGDLVKTQFKLDTADIFDILAGHATLRYPLDQLRVYSPLSPTAANPEPGPFLKKDQPIQRTGTEAITKVKSIDLVVPKAMNPDIDTNSFAVGLIHVKLQEVGKSEVIEIPGVPVQFIRGTTATPGNYVVQDCPLMAVKSVSSLPVPQGPPPSPTSSGSSFSFACRQYTSSVGDYVCPSGYEVAKPEDAVFCASSICAILGDWHIARLAGGGSIDGRAYGCEYRSKDTRGIGHTLCRSATTPTYNCYWMYQSSPWDWRSTGPLHNASTTRARCKELDACNGGGNQSQGGCYKWAIGPNQPGERW